MQYINLEVENEKWKPIQLIKNGPPLSYLFFANDILLFSKAFKQQVETITEILSYFYKSLRQLENHSKSYIFFLYNVNNRETMEIS